MWRQRVSSIVSLWSFTICLTPYNRKFKNVLSASLNKRFPSFLPSMEHWLGVGGGGGGGGETHRTAHKSYHTMDDFSHCDVQHSQIEANQAIDFFQLSRLR